MNRLFQILFLCAFSLLSVGCACFLDVRAAYAKEAAKGGEEGVVHPEFEYLQLKPLVLPIITDRGLSQQVSLVVSIEIAYGAKEEVLTLEPRLADAYLMDLYGALGAGQSMMRGNVLDVQAIKARLTDVTVKVLGKDKFHDVLLQVVHQRSM